MTVIDLPGEAMVRDAYAPIQPKGTRWYTDCGNSEKTAHLYVAEHDGVLQSHCGRDILLSDRLGESSANKHCKRCLKRAERS